MDTTRIMAVSRMGIIRAGEHATAAEQRLAEAVLKENRAAIVMYLLVECAIIVSHRKTFVNEQKNDRFDVCFIVFLYTTYKSHYSPSKTALHSARTLLKTGTQALLP